MARRLVTAAATSSAIAAAGFTVVAMPLTAEAAETPLITCASPSSLFNTGAGADGGGVVSPGQQDLRWEAVGPLEVSGSAAPAPPGSGWGPAYVTWTAPGWDESPYGGSAWITAEEGGGQSPDGDWYYRYRFDLDPEVEPGQLSLALDFMADNSVHEIWVNGQPQSGQAVNLPMTSGDPYQYVGYQQQNRSQTLLQSGWATGPNEIVVLIKSGAAYEGFLAAAQPTATCLQPSSATATAAASRTAVGRVGQSVTFTSQVANTGEATLAQVAADVAAFNGTGSTPTFTCAPTSLAAGEGATCTATYTVAAGDLVLDELTLTLAGSGLAAGYTERTVSPGATVSVDVAVPGITITGGAESLTNSPLEPVRGTATGVPPGTAVSVVVDGAEISTTVGPDGSWSWTPSTPWTEGAHMVVASVTDEVSGGIATAEQTLGVDLTSPTLTIDQPDPTRDTTPTLGGGTDAPDGSTVTVTIGGRTLSATATGGRWSVTPTEPLPEGENAFTARVEDAAGNSTTASSAVTVDLTAPSIAIDGPEVRYTRDALATITGTTDAPAGTSVTVRVGEHVLTAPVDEDGSWEAVLDVELPDGEYAVRATVSDELDNESVAEQTLVVDTTPPLVVSLGPEAPTNDTTPTITGVAPGSPDGTVVTVQVGGQTFATTVTGGAWAATVPEPLAHGEYDVVASVRDQAGNEDTSTAPLTIDVTGPGLTIDGGEVVRTVDRTPVVRGTATDASPFDRKVTVEVANEVHEVEVAEDGTWSVQLGRLPVGTYPVRVTAQDALGNEAVVEQELVIEPGAVTVEGGATVSTEDATPVVSGTTTMPPGSTVVVTVAGQRYETVVDQDGAWSVTLEALAPGVYRVLVEITDLDGNTVASEQALTVVAPEVLPTDPEEPETSPVEQPAEQPTGGGLPDTGISGPGWAEGFALSGAGLVLLLGARWRGRRTAR